MSHPLVVEAAETLFTPVCIFNNTSGDADDRARRRFSEPAWNNPVVRILNADEKDLAPRRDRPWTVEALLETMVRALEADHRPVPKWLALFAWESAARAKKVETAIFGMT